jgi:hypothetical protein
MEWQALTFEEEVFAGVNREVSKRASSGDQELLVNFPAYLPYRGC